MLTYCRAGCLVGRMRPGLVGWSWRCGGALVDPRCKSWSSLRPVLKHGPRSLAYTRVIGWKTHRRNESEGPLVGLICDPLCYGAAEQHSPVSTACSGAEDERTRWYPKDGELCLSRMKPGETLVEVRSASDVQIDRLTWV